MTKTKRALLIIIILIFLIGILTVPNLRMVYADSIADLKYSGTNVMTDLRSDPDFDIRNYPFDESKEMTLVSFIEYCYSFKANMRSNYNLYLIVYNPQGLNIDTASPLNKVQMATSYNSKGEPNDYGKYELTYCNKSIEPNYYGLFYKFRVVMSMEEKTALLSRLNSNERRYDVSDFELLETDKLNARDYPVSLTYTYSGYAAGYGADSSAESTLECNYLELETLSLNVKHTYFRPEGTISASDRTKQNQLNSVYFSVPNKYFDKYGDISAIKAEWYEYRTRPVFVTGNSDVYNGLIGYVGQNISAMYENGWSASKTVNYGFAVNRYSDYGASEYAYNILDPINSYTTVLDTLHYLFKASGSADDYTLSGEAVKDFAYSKRSGETDLINGKYPRRYFTLDVGGGRTAGYNVKTISSTDEYKMSSFVLGDSWFEKNWHIGTTTEYSSIKAIKQLTDTDIQSTAEETSQLLYVSEGDYSDIKTYHANAKKAEETTVLFRFAISDYYAAEAYNCKFIWFFGDKTELMDTNAYCAIQNVFIDFDIIHLEFQKDGQVTVIPVVSDPIDIFSDITPPVLTTDDGGMEWWQILLAVLLVIALLILLMPVLPHIISFIISFVATIVKVVWAVLAAPFKLVGKLVKRKDKNYEKD